MSLRLVHVDRPMTDSLAWRLALAGEWPADALSTLDRQALVLVLHQRGWCDVEIASHTRMTTYTTARIRARLGLAVNTANGAAA